jgi:hypothetical protein
MRGPGGGGVTATKGKPGTPAYQVAGGKPVRPSPQAMPLKTSKNPYIPPRRPRPKPDAQGSGSANPYIPPRRPRPKPAPSPVPAQPAWWERNPTDIIELLRQLSVNAGQMGMPGGYVGAVQKPAFGTGGQPMIPQEMRTYGQAPNMGEATFFQQGMNGGMAPIAAMSPLGVPAGWNPLGQTPPQKPPQKPSRPHRPSNQRGQGNDMGGFGIVDGRIGMVGFR